MIWYFFSDTDIDIEESIPQYVKIPCLLYHVVHWICCVWLGCSRALPYKGWYDMKDYVYLHTRQEMGRRTDKEGIWW